MGIFDMPAPLLAWVDHHAAMVMPAWLRLALWGGIGALVSMVLYRQLSAQDKIVRGKNELNQAKQRLNAFDGEFNEAWPLMRDMLNQALRQVMRVGWPAIVASLPLLFLLSWLSNTFGYAFPPAGTSVQIQTVPGRYEAVWVDPPAGNATDLPRIVVFDENHIQVAETQMQAPVPVIHKRQWWNGLFGNPVGYLPVRAPVERIQPGLPRQQHLAFGPQWMRGWEFIFFVSLLVVSIILKKQLKIA